MFALNRLLPIVGVVFLSFLYSQNAQAEICWDPQVVDGPVSDGEDSKVKKNNKGGKGKKNGSDDITTQHSCGYPTPPPPTPSTPGTPSVSATNSTSGSYTVSWSASSNMKTSGTSQWGYELMEYRGGSFVKKYQTSPTTTSQSISNNSDGNYQYKVRGCNMNLNTGLTVCSSYTSLSAVNYVRHKPSAPSTPSLGSSTSTGSATVSWSKPSGNVAFYRIQKRKNNGSWVWADSYHTGTSRNLSGLTDGSWDFRVRACNGEYWACSSYSTDSSNVTVRNKPSTPATPSITSSLNNTTGTITLSWSKPSGTVGMYDVIEYKAGVSGYKEVAGDTTNTSVTLTGKSDGDYRYRVRACNVSWSCSSYSNYSATSKIRHKPSTPATPSITSSLNNTTGTITLSWSKPSGTVGMYDVIEYKAGESGYEVVANNTTVTSLSLTGKTDGDYRYRVRACNVSWSCSSYSNYSATSKIRHKPSTPATPSITSSLNNTTGTITLSWSKSSGTVGMYDVIEYKAGVSGYKEVAGDTTNTSVTLTGKSDGDYRYRVRACNVSWSCSSYSSYSSYTTVLHKPGTPASISGPTATDVDGNFAISWGVSSGQVDYYQTAHRNKPIGGSFGSWIYENRGSVRSYSYSGLANGEWDFAVRGCNDSGCSGWRYISPHVQVLHKPETPPSISGPTLTDVDGTHTISWGVSSGQIDSYELRQRFKSYGSSSFGAWSTAYNSTGRSKYFSLLNDGEYDYAVRACNASGCSSFKYISPHITVLKPPYNPSVSVNSSSNDGIYTVSWQNGGGIVDEYHYSESPNYDTWISAGTATSRVISGKSDGSWSYRVKSCNTSGCSGHGTSNTVTVNHPTPDTPPSIDVPVETAETSYSISWEPSTSAVLDYYQISQQHEANGWSGWTKVTGNSAQVIVDEAGDWKHRVRACNELPDLTKKCGSARESGVVNVQLPPDWGRTEGTVADKDKITTSTLSGDTIGAIQGKAGVSGGAAVYNIPIQIPPGRKGMQPDISLSYSSRSGNGIAGKGWSLSAGGSIHRCALLWELDNDSRNINLTTQDKLCLNGERLVLRTGTYGQGGATYRPETSPHIKVIQTNGINDSDSEFEVQQGNGAVSHYGTTSDSRLSRSGTTVNSRWLLKKREDAAGKNNIIYSYSASGDAGSRYLTTITYTGFNGSAGNRKVEFFYGDRNDNSESYLLGTFSESSKRLSKIQSSVNGSLATEYTLNYRVAGDAEPITYQVVESSSSSPGEPQYTITPVNTGTSTHANRPDSVSLLTSIKQCAWSSSGIKQCLPETDFTLQSFDPVLSTAQKLQSFSDGSHWPSISEVGFNGDIDNSFDIDGDGTPDIGYVQNSTVFNFSDIWLSSKRSAYQVPSGFLPLGTSSGSTNVAQRSLTLDWNRDGKQDLIGRKYDGGDYYLSVLYWDDATASLKTVDFSSIDTKCESAYYYDDPTRPPEEVAFSDDHRNCNSYVLDANGDGASDLVIATRPSSDIGTDAGINLNLYFSCDVNGSLGFCPTSASVSNLKTDKAGRNVDLNGDGKQELVFTVGSLGDYGNLLEEVLYRPVNQEGSWSFVESSSGFEGYRGSAYHYQDLNGDGLQDMLYQDPFNGEWTFRKNTGTGYSSGVIIGSLPSTTRKYETQGEFNKPTYLGGNLQFFDYDQDGLLDVIAPTKLLHEASCESENVYQCNRQEQFKTTFGRPYIYDYYDIYEWSIFKATLSSNGYLSYQKVGVGNVVIEAPLLDLKFIDFNSDGALDIVTRLGYEDDTFTMTGSYSAGIYAYRNPNSRVDYVLKVDNGLVEDEFGYQALYQPSDFSKSQSQRFYDVDLSSNSNSWPYSYFGTATQMVSVHNTDNGVGGVTTSRLQYRNARYHHQGRGFQGFGEIIEVKPQLGLKTATEYEQSYPLSGRTKQSSQYAKGNYNAYQLVSQSTTSYDFFKNSGVYTVYPQSSNSYSYDLASGSELTHKTVTISNVDQWGNVGNKVETHSDQFGTVTTNTTHSYAPLTGTTWWPNKKTKTVVTSNPVAGRTSGAPVPGGADTVKSVTTEILSYHPDYWVPTSVETSGSDTSLTTTITTSLTKYGLPQAVTTKGTDVDGKAMTVRSATTGYTASPHVGYFVNSITNAKGHETTTVTAPKTGKPRSVTDPNGLITTMDYDAFGRNTKTTVPGAQDIVAARYWCVSNCPQYGAYYTKTIQSGSPTSLEYFDTLGRSLGADSTGFDGATIAQRVTYNAKGQKTFESVPYYEVGGDPTLGSYYVSYDNLGRLTKKRVNQSVSDMTVNYTYNGLETDIQVSAPNTIGSLSMSRAYNGLKQLIYTKDAKGNYTRYAYDGAGNPISLQDAGGNSIEAWYNALGHKTSVDDPNMGIKTFGYNSLGEVEREQDANGQVVESAYDTLGRLITRSVNNATQASFAYDTRKKGLLSTETSYPSSGSKTKNYYYDSKARPTLARHTVDGINYDVRTAYDANYGYVKSLQYPSGLTVGYSYDSNGYLTKQFNAKVPGYVYQEVTAQDAYQNVTTAKLADDVLTQTQSYYGATGQMATSQVQTTSGAHDRHYLSYRYDGYGNLQSQTVYYGLDSSEETYQYDVLHRLKATQRTFSNGAATQSNSYDYDAMGNFTAKSDYATSYSYGNLPNAVSSVTKLDGSTVTFGYDASGNMTQGDGKSLDYNAFNKPILITKGSITSEFFYGADLSRYKQVKQGGEDGTVTTTYIDKLYEKVVTDTAGQAKTTEYRHYIGDVAILTRKDTAGQAIPEHSINYTLRDRLGSVVTLTNHQGDITEFRSYDAFGKPRKGSMENVDPAKPATLAEVAGASSYFKQTTRGFTDHEHLDDAELIHMNGRAYDYNLGRFLSVDPFIQEPGNSQSMNPYSYIMNNPLAGTDPSGYVANVKERQQAKSNANCNADPNCHVVDMSGNSGGNGADTSNDEKTDSSDVKPTNTSGSSDVSTDDAKSYLSKELSKEIEWDVVEKSRSDEDIVLGNKISDEDIKRIGVKRLQKEINLRRGLKSNNAEFGHSRAYDAGLLIIEDQKAWTRFKVISGIKTLDLSGNYPERDAFTGTDGSRISMDENDRIISIIFGTVNGDPNSASWHVAFRDYNIHSQENISNTVNRARRLNAASIIYIDKNNEYSEFFGNGSYSLYNSIED